MSKVQISRGQTKNAGSGTADGRSGKSDRGSRKKFGPSVSRLELAGNLGDVVLFNLAIDSTVRYPGVELADAASRARKFPCAALNIVGTSGLPEEDRQDDDRRYTPRRTARSIDDAVVGA